MLTDIQHSELRSGIGASECGVVLGIDPYKTPYELWLEKTGKILPEDLSEQPQIIMGNLLEPVIAERYSQKTGEKLEIVPTAYRHPDYPHILCHIDRKVMGKEKGLEIKKANPFSRAWGEEGSDEVPMYYIAQVQHQMACTGFYENDLASYRGGADIQIYPFLRDPQAIEVILQKLDYFWKEHVLADIPPPATTRGDLRKMYHIGNGEFIDASSDIIDICRRINVIKKEAKALAEERDDLEFKVHEFMGIHDGLWQLDQQILATNKADKNGKRTLRIYEVK